MELKEVVIGCSRWLRGKGGNASGLRRKVKNGKPVTMMCCLGFAAKACGYSNAELMDKYMPYQLPKAEERLPELAVQQGTHGIGTNACNEMARVNDDMHISDDVRKKKLIALAKQAGFKFIFVD